MIVDEETLEVLLRNRFREFSELEKDLQRIAIRRFFAILEETKGKSRRGSILINILRMYKFEKDDLIKFIRIFDEIKDINWVRSELVGFKE